LVIPSGSYRTVDFVTAARDLRIDLVVASDGDLPMGGLGKARTLTIDFTRPEWSASRIANLKPSPDAVISAGDRGVMIAAMASNILGVPANPLGAVSSTRDKAHMRGLLAGAGVPQPAYRLAGPGEVAACAGEIGFPCVVKPRGLSASRGVIRVDSRDEATRVEERIRTIVAEAGEDPDETLVVESFVAGDEVALEGMLVDGELVVLALLDKPDALDGPYFEETMFISPSRHDASIREEIASVTQAASRALGLVTGPIHAEVRCGTRGVSLIEVAARSIGGLCGRALTFGLLGESLESVILRSALGMPGKDLDVAARATGVMMLPIPDEGVLVAIDGTAEALAVDGVTEFDQTIPNGKRVVPLPEGDRYLGFLFARGATPGEVEDALRRAHGELVITIDPNGDAASTGPDCR
jgi:biotin carboxylase